MPETSTYKPRLRAHYDDVVRQKMIEQFGYKNAMEVPHVTKIVINMGVGEAVADSKKAATAAGDLALVAGQKPTDLTAEVKPGVNEITFDLKSAHPARPKRK